MDEVRDRALQAYEAELVSEALSARAAELEAVAKEAGSLEPVAEATGLGIEPVYDVRRTGKPGLDRELVAAAFGGPNGHVALVPSGDGYAILKVDRVVAVAEAGEAAPRDAEEDVLAQFVADLQQRTPPTFNPDAAQRALAAGRGGY